MLHIDFKTLISDITSKYSKIPQERYLESGLLPVIDQGKYIVGGYTNESVVNNGANLPVIVFGDHTKIFKFIDFPFTIGADGAKVLEIDTKVAFPKYVYYYLKTIDLPKVGYSRHYKFLKEIKIPFPIYSSQIRIANLLEKIEQLIDERRKSIDVLDELIQATYYKTFGDSVRNEKRWEIKQIGEVCNVTKLAGFEYTKYIKYKDEGDIVVVRGLNVKNGRIKLKDVKYIDRTVSDSLKRSKLFKNDVVITYIGVNIGDVAIIEEDDKYHLAPNVAKITPKNLKKLNSYFLMYYLMFNRLLFFKHTTNTAKQALNMGNIREVNIIIPPSILQNQFASVAQKIEKAREEQEAQLKDLEELYASVSQKVFKGELDLSRVPFDESLLPVEQSVYKEEKIISEEQSEQIKISPPVAAITRELPNIKAGNFTWEQISFERVANSIKANFGQHYFNNEMLLRYLEDDLGIEIRYYSSADKKKNPAFEEADDLHSFITGAVNEKNNFLQLEQKFYNAEKENIPDISFTDEDLDRLEAIEKENRSGIYFRIKSEITES